MHPVLFHLGPLTIHTYGFFIAVGFLTSINLIKYLAARANLNVDRILDLTFWCLVVGFSGCRILFVITRFDEFYARPFDIIKIWEGGLVFLGGPMLGIPFAITYIRKHKLPIWKTFDVLTPALVLSHAFGRLGCLGAGCCYGKPTGTSFGVRLYSDLVDRAHQGIPLHPTQLYESFILFILFGALIYLFHHKRFDGQVFLSYLLTYPIIRSIIEIFRGDLIRGFIIDGVLSTSQFISIWFFFGALIALIFRLRQKDLKQDLKKDRDGRSSPKRKKPRTTNQSRSSNPGR